MTRIVFENQVGTSRMKWNGADVTVLERAEGFKGGVGAWIVDAGGEGGKFGAYGDELFIYPEPVEGKPFPCPDCGFHEWRVTYRVYESQDARVVFEGGRPSVEEYLGNGCQDYDGTEEEEMSCQMCGTVIPLRAA